MDQAKKTVGYDMIQVENLKKTFRVHKKEPGLKGSIKSLFSRKWIEKKAVKGVSLNVSSGEILGLIGANGAGKTTLVKMLSGIISPTSGEASVLGHVPWKRKDEMRRQIALVMGQKAQLWWDLPAADCFLLLKEIYEIPDDLYHQNIQKLSEGLGVTDLLTTQIRRLSLGERMKMELMAALLHSPKVLFLDEPTIGLDLNAQKAIRKFLLNYIRENEVAIILTSHYMEDIEQLCKRIVILSDGEIIYDGEISSVIEKYATYKILTITPEDDDAKERQEKLFHQKGYEFEFCDGRWKIKVPRNEASAIAAEIFKEFRVTDVNLEEQEISDIISFILREKGVRL